MFHHPHICTYSGLSTEVRRVCFKIDVAERFPFKAQADSYVGGNRVEQVSVRV